MATESVRTPAGAGDFGRAATFRVLPNPAPVSSHTTAITCLPNDRWDTLLGTHPTATVFHTSNWARVLMRTYGHQPHYLRFERADKTVALVPLMEISSLLTGRRGVCLPFSDECPPLLFDGTALPLVMTELEKIARGHGWKWCELRGDAKGDGAAESASFRGDAESEVAPAFYGHTLDLTCGAERLLAGCSEAVRRGIRKAEKNKLTAEIDTSTDAMEDYYRLHCNTRRRHGAPPQPQSFFRHISEEIIAAGLGFIVTVRRGGRCIAAAVFFCYGQRALFKFGASERQALEFRPNNFCLWRGIEHLAQLGYHTLQFGRTEPANQGLRRFKQGWGATEYPIIYKRLSSESLRSQKNASGVVAARCAQEVFRRLPVFANRLAGRVLYPHLD
jgi:CelD/BcsL family acetyltransferase involved in cellulose biosynthesis